MATTITVPFALSGVLESPHVSQCWSVWSWVWWNTVLQLGQESHGVVVCQLGPSRLMAQRSSSHVPVDASSQRATGPPWLSGISFWVYRGQWDLLDPCKSQKPRSLSPYIRFQLSCLDRENRQGERWPGNAGISRTPALCWASPTRHFCPAA